jgi:hypothetical protein
MNVLAGRFVTLVDTVRAMPAAQLLLRVVIVIVGVAAVLSLNQPWESGAGFMAVVALVGLLATIVAPHGAAPGFTMGVLVFAWILAYGLRGDPPVANTIGLAVTLYLLHSAAALAGAMPPTARPDGQLIVRWCAQASITLVASAVVIGIGYGMGRLQGSLTLELLGLAGVLLLVMTPVWLLRSRD